MRREAVKPFLARAVAALLLLCVAAAACAQGNAGKGRQRDLYDQIVEAERAGNLARAEDLARQFVVAAEGGPDRRIGNGYRKLGSILRQRGKFAEAEIALTKGLPYVERGFGRLSPQAIRALFDLVRIHYVRARYTEAADGGKEVLARLLQTSLPEQYLVQAYLYLAYVERTLGRFDEAETLLGKAESVAANAKADPGGGLEFSLGRWRAKVVYEFGVLRYYQRRDAEAETRLREALQRFERIPGGSERDIASCKTTLGTVLTRTGRLEDAEATLRDALALSERAYGKNHAQTARAKLRLALAIARRGRPAEAEALFKRAIEDKRAAGELARQADYERAYGQFLAQQKRLAEALDQYRSALDRVDRIFAQTQGLDEAGRESFVAQYASWYFETVRLLLRLHAARPAAGHDREALAVVSRTQSRIFSEMLRIADVGKLTGDPAFVELRRRQAELKTKLAYAQRARILALADEPQDEGEGERDPDAGPIAPLGRRARAAILQERSRTRVAQIAQEIAGAERERASVEAALWEKYPRYMELTQPRPVTVEALQAKLLRPQETLLSYFLLPERTLILVVGRNHFRLTQIPRSRKDITAMVAAARGPEEDISSSFAGLAQLDPGVLHRLYETLFQPVESDLKPGQPLLVVGDGPVHTLPLEMLVTRWSEEERRAFEAARAEKGALLGEYAKLAYLGERYPFSYLPSLSSLVSLRLHGKPTAQYDRDLVSFADPVFGGDDLGATTRSALRRLTRSVRPSSSLERLRIPRLPETADEAREIAAIVGGRSDLYLGENAQEHTTKTLNLKTTRYVHFATHGLLGGEFLRMRAALTSAGEANGSRTSADDSAAAEDVPPAPRFDERGEPALLLSLSGDLRGEDGLLTMSEVAESMELNAQLAVLSACNTAGEGGDAVNGEGFAGLTRAFMYAGARGLVVSHWSVESRTTKELITELFRELRGGASNLAALQRARERIRVSVLPGDQTISRAHPYFWAPFIHVAD